MKNLALGSHAAMFLRRHRAVALGIAVTVAVACGDGTAPDDTDDPVRVPVAFEFLVQPTSNERNEILRPPIQVAVLDNRGQLIEDASTLIYLNAHPHPEYGEGGQKARAVSGIAVFDSLRITHAAQAHTLRAWAWPPSGIVEGISDTFDVWREPFVHVTTGSWHSCGVSEDSIVYCWGYGRWYNLGTGGDGPQPNRNTPTPVDGPLMFSQVHSTEWHTCAVTRDGAAYCWGLNYEGELGDGIGENHSSPAMVAGGAGYAEVRAGSLHSCGLRRDGTVYCWGSSAYGQRGDGTDTSSTAPVPVSGDYRFKALAAGESFSCAATESGTAYCWGLNDWGQLGDGTVENRWLPTPVAGGLSFVSLSAGFRHTCGIATDSTAHCWGLNSNGQLGIGADYLAVAAPMPVAGGMRFRRISAGPLTTCAVTADSSAYCWGFNSDGQLGDGTLTGTPVPVAVVGDLKFASVSTGAAHTCGVASGGVMYCWGANGRGQIGDGSWSDAVSRPTQVSRFTEYAPPAPRR
jgi:alpha-tubulin suppressor-like RCC1 family protein